MSELRGAHRKPGGLAGATVEYRYPTGNHYRLRFTDTVVKFEHVHLPGAADVTLPYRDREIRPGLFLVSWIRKPGIHTSLVIDVDRRQVHVSAMLPPDHRQFFDVAEIVGFSRR